MNDTEAVGYWNGWPILLEAYECRDGLTPETRYNARAELAREHLAATRWLMDECDRLGLDGATLWEESQLCRERIMEGDFRAGRQASFQTWPEVLGKDRYELPASAQAAVASGEAMFMRLVAKLDGDKTPPKPSGKRLTPAEWELLYDEFQTASEDDPSLTQSRFGKMKGIKHHTTITRQFERIDRERAEAAKRAQELAREKSRHRT